MSYGLKYIASYDTLVGDNCRIEILEKNYTGIVYPMELSAEPFKQTYDTDEEKPYIKGCSGELAYNNTNGVLPLENFYSPEDDQFEIRHYYKGALTFKGFIVQTDCSEDLLDYKHEVILSANDNLGLLKDVALDENIPDFGYIPAAVELHLDTPTGDCFVYLYNTDYIPAVSVPFTISGHSNGLANNTFTPLAITDLGRGNWKVQVADLSFTSTIAFPSKITGTGTINLYNRNTLLDIIRVCLYNTGLELDTVIFANVFEESHNTNYCFLQQTYVDAQTYLDNDKFKSCWDTLQYIFNRFKLTLFQSGGRWVILRTNEVRYGNVNGFIYDNSFTLIGTDTFGASPLSFGFNQNIKPITAPKKSIIRPYKYNKETFNYQQPKYILKNNDLLSLGTLITSYTTGSGAGLKNIYEYVATNWNPSGFGATPNYFIRVVQDNEFNEIERYLVIKGTTGDTARSVVGVPFEVSEKDKVIFEFTFVTNVSQAGPINLVTALRLFDGTTTRYANEDKTINWRSTLGWVFQIPTGGNTNTNQQVVINPGQIPYDGLIYCYLPQACDTPQSPTDETHIKDIRITYTPYINDSTKIIGHYHLQEQPLNIKNNQDETIYVDDSPRSSIIGALFQAGFTGVLQNRTRKWFRATNNTERLRIGEIITFEQLFALRIPRTKIEGSFIGVDGVSMLSRIVYNPFTAIQFIFGRLEISFKNNTFDCTLFQEVLLENDSDLLNTYTFDYIYSTK